MEKNILLIKYQDNFADNLSVYVNAKIIAKNSNFNCFYENISKSRNNFEEMMSCFNLKCNYISQNRANEITKKVPKKRFIKQNYYINNKNFDFSNLDKLTNDILSEINFKKESFIVNHDLLEEITKQNSIGLYINKNDAPDFAYIQKATKRLNKYLKQPILYIFAQNIDFNNIMFDINHKIINIADYKEEFYLLAACKHKIIHNTPNSFSEGLWASVIKQKDYNYVIYDKKNKAKKNKQNWIKV